MGDAGYQDVAFLSLGIVPLGVQDLPEEGLLCDDIHTLPFQVGTTVYGTLRDNQALYLHWHLVISIAFQAVNITFIFPVRTEV